MTAAPDKKVIEGIESPDPNIKSKIKPCPACGGISFQLRRGGFDQVRCFQCDASGPMFDGHPESAIADWNALPRRESHLKLKRCPFCGGQAGHSKDMFSRHHVRCFPKCGGFVEALSEKEAREAWNRRFGEDQNDS